MFQLIHVVNTKKCYHYHITKQRIIATNGFRYLLFNFSIFNIVDFSVHSNFFKYFKLY